MNYVPAIADTTVRTGTIEVQGLNIFYREAGMPGSPKLVLLHGFPASSHQYRNLIPALAHKFHVISMDYPGFGNSALPDLTEYSYTFDKTSDVVEGFLNQKGFTRFGLFVQDYGGPVGFRILARRPEWLQWLIVQNTNAYEEGFTAAWDGFRNALWKKRTPESEKPLMGFLEVDAIRSIYLHGHKKPELISPDNWNMDARFMERPQAREYRWNSSTTTAPTSPCIRGGKSFCEVATPKRSSSGARTTSSSPVKVARPICGICPRLRCINSIRVTSRWRIVWITSPGTSYASLTRR